jgi:pimeloyl-ACP methyl ester carboxylesterase
VLLLILNNKSFSFNNKNVFFHMHIDGQDDWMDHRAAEAAVKTMDVPTKVIIIPGAGHHIHLDNSIDFDKAVVNEMLESSS